MAKKSEKNVREGYEVVNTKIPFFPLGEGVTNKGEERQKEFFGIYKGFKEMPSDKVKSGFQIVWLALRDDDKEMYYITENSMMHDCRVQLKEGDKFGLIYMGKAKAAKSGNTYKEYEFLRPSDAVRDDHVPEADRY